MLHYYYVGVNIPENAIGRTDAPWLQDESHWADYERPPKTCEVCENFQARDNDTWCDFCVVENCMDCGDWSAEDVESFKRAYPEKQPPEVNYN